MYQYFSFPDGVLMLSEMLELLIYRSIFLMGKMNYSTMYDQLKHFSIGIQLSPENLPNKKQKMPGREKCAIGLLNFF